MAASARRREAASAPGAARWTGQAGMKRSCMTDGYGMPLDRVLALWGARSPRGL
jgi:hypothetical protein